MKDYRAYFIDLDGTMYRGEEHVEGASEFIRTLRNDRIPYLFLTNNSSRMPGQVAEKLRGLDIPASPEQVFTTSMATARYIGKEKAKAKVFVIGEEGLYEALKQEGLELVEEGADYVVVGIDREITYEKLAKACLNIRNGARFISTNADIAIPTDRGMLPGNGAITSVISVSTGVDPLFIGKPEAIIMEQALDKLGCEKEEVLMVGDNYNTDILAGIHAGIDTLMVETGLSTFEEIREFTQQPTYKYKKLTDWINSDR